MFGLPAKWQLLLLLWRRIIHLQSITYGLSLWLMSVMFQFFFENVEFSRVRCFSILRTFYYPAFTLFVKKKRFSAPGANSWASANIWIFRGPGSSARSVQISSFLNPNTALNLAINGSSAGKSPPQYRFHYSRERAPEANIPLWIWQRSNWRTRSLFSSQTMPNIPCSISRNIIPRGMN